MLLIYLFLFSLLAKGYESKCSDFGSIHLLEQFYTWEINDNLTFKWNQSVINDYTRNVQLIGRIAKVARDAEAFLIPKAYKRLSELDKIEGYSTTEGSSTPSTAKGQISLHDRPTYSSLEHRKEVLLLDSYSYADAYDKCATKEGHLPELKNLEEEKSLVGLAVKYQLSSILVSANLNRKLHGPITKFGYLIGVWGPLLKRPNKGGDIDTGFRNVVRYRFVGIENIKTARAVLPETLFEKEMNSTGGRFLCLKTISQWQTSRDEIKTFQWLLNDLEWVCHLLYKSVKINKHMFDHPETQVEAPSKPEPIEGGQILLGIEGYSTLLYSLTEVSYYTRSDINHITSLNSAITLLKATLDDYDVPDRDYVSMVSTTGLMNFLLRTNKYHTESQMIHFSWFGDVKSLMSVVRIKLIKSHSDNVWTASIKRIARYTKTGIYKIRKFITKDQQQVTDNYVVDAGERSFSSQKLPRTGDCTKLGDHLACTEPTLDGNHGPPPANVMHDKCGKNIILYGNAGGCGKAVVNMEIPYIVTHARCEKDEVEENEYKYYDVLNSNFEGQLTKTCDGFPSEDIKFKIGHQTLPTSYNRDCNYEYKGTKIHGRSAGDGDIGDEDYTHSTILGPISTRDMRYLVVAFVSLTSTLLATIILACCPRCRNAIAFGLCCCCHENGWMAWKNMVSDAAKRCRRCFVEDDTEVYRIDASGRSSRGYTARSRSPSIRMEMDLLNKPRSSIIRPDSNRGESGALIPYAGRRRSEDGAIDFTPIYSVRGPRVNY